MPSAKTPSTEGLITIKRLEDVTVQVKVNGITPVIPHQWSEKAKRMMPGHPNRDTMSKKGARQPEEEAEACVYRMPDGRPAMPAGAFKGAMVAGCRFFEEPSMTEAKLLFNVAGEGPDQLVPIEGTPILREDTVRNSGVGSTADLRYRYAFHDWSAVLTIKYIPTRMTASSVVALLDAGGRVGVGDWRPGAPKSHTGTFGQFRVAEEQA